MFGATGEAGLCLTCVFCRCLEQQEKLARVSPVCCADVWSNKRSGLCVVKGVQNHRRSWCVAEHAIGASVTNVSCVFCRCSGAPGVLSLPVSPVFCRCVKQQKFSVYLCYKHPLSVLQVFRAPGEADGVLLDVQGVHLSPMCPVGRHCE